MTVTVLLQLKAVNDIYLYKILFTWISFKVYNNFHLSLNHQYNDLFTVVPTKSDSDVI